MIDDLIHFYRKGRKPFQSLTMLPEWAALQIMEELYVEGVVIWERFKEPAGYLRERQQTEQWLREAFIAKGGKPPEFSPIYMILGTSQWLIEMNNETLHATTQEIHVPLCLFSEYEISFTYPDSMVSYILAKEQNPDYYLPEYHGRVFTLPEIRAIIEANGLPGARWGNNLPHSLANYIEAQVWNHKPLRDLERISTADYPATS